VLYANTSEQPVLEDEWTELILAIAQGNEAALHELYERTHRIVFTLSYRIAKDSLTAEEITLDVYHDVWRKAATFDPKRGSVIAWLMNQCRSRAIDAVRSRRRKKRSDSGVAADAGGEETDPFELEQRRRSLERSLQALTLEERRAIEGAYFGERTYAEVAEQLGEPLGTIKTRIRTGLLKLQTMLDGEDLL
jgi:RNA polymerase sigma-70 factor (ECF subfamily)